MSRHHRAAQTSSQPQRPTIIGGFFGLTAFSLLGSAHSAPAPPWSWLGYGLLSIAMLPLAWHYERSVGAVLYVAIGVASVDFLLYAMAWLHRLATDLPAAEARAGAIEVARERRRLLRDAHDVLGFRLSALVLKLELARRGDAERMHEELAEARTQARAALVEAHALTADSPELSLPTQFATTAALLSAAGISVESAARLPAGTGVGPIPALSPQVDVVLATVLREATTNVLRHSTARRCSIELTANRRTVRLVVVNDGAATPSEPTVQGTVLAGLNERVGSIGGMFTATARDGEFILDMRVPVGRRGRPRPATPVVPAVGLAVLAATYTAGLTLPDPAVLDARFLLLALAFAAGLAHLCRPRRHGRRPAAWRPVFAVLILLAYVPLLAHPNDAWAMRHYLGGPAPFLLHGRTRWLAATAILAAEIALGVAAHAPATTLTYHVAADLDDSAIIFALVQLPLLTGAFTRAQERLAVTAAARERSRFADQLGERLNERPHSVLRALTPAGPADGGHLDPDGLAMALHHARTAAADLREAAAGAHS